MVITYHGEGCFRIQSGPLSLVVDPLNERQKPDIILKTAVPSPPEKPDISTVVGAGEYEIKEVSIKGCELLKESNAKILKTAYAVDLEDIKLGFLGEMFEMPEPELIEALGEIDILFLPIGGKPYLTPDAAAKVVKQIEPSIVIPSFYKNPKDFFEEMGQKTVPQDKLTIKKKEIIEAGESIKVVCLTA